MHNRHKVALMAGLLCISTSIFATVYDYFGVDYKYRNMHGHNTDTYDTRPVLPKVYNGAQVYYIHRFVSDVGINIGYEQSAKETHNNVFTAGQLFLGARQRAGDTSYTRTSIRAVQFNMVGFLDFKRHWEAIGQFGFSLMNADITGTITSLGVTSNLTPSQAWKFVPTLSIGIIYFILNGKFGIRLMGDWEGTNFYRQKWTDDDGVRYTIRPFKQSWCFTTGVLARF